GARQPPHTVWRSPEPAPGTSTVDTAITTARGLVREAWVWTRARSWKTDAAAPTRKRQPWVHLPRGSVTAPQVNPRGSRTRLSTAHPRRPHFQPTLSRSPDVSGERGLQAAPTRRQATGGQCGAGSWHGRTTTATG